MPLRIFLSTWQNSIGNDDFLASSYREVETDNELTQRYGIELAPLMGTLFGSSGLHRRAVGGLGSARKLERCGVPNAALSSPCLPY